MRNPRMNGGDPAEAGGAWPRIMPEDRKDRSNLQEHNLMIASMNAAIDVAEDAAARADTATELSLQAEAEAESAHAAAVVASQVAQNAHELVDDLAARMPTEIYAATRQCLIPTRPAFSLVGDAIRFTQTQRDGRAYNEPVPERTSASAGLMMKEDVAALASLDSRVSILEGSHATGGLYAVLVHFTGMTDSQRDSACEGEKGSPATDGDVCIDLDSKFWIRASMSGGDHQWINFPQVAIPDANGAQLIKSSTDDGKITINSDQTAEVSGWNQVKSDATAGASWATAGPPQMDGIADRVTEIENVGLPAKLNNTAPTASAGNVLTVQDDGTIVPLPPAAGSPVYHERLDLGNDSAPVTYDIGGGVTMRLRVVAGSDTSQPSYLGVRITGSSWLRQAATLDGKSSGSGSITSQAFQVHPSGYENTQVAAIGTGAQNYYMATKIIAIGRNVNEWAPNLVKTVELMAHRVNTQTYAHYEIIITIY